MRRGSTALACAMVVAMALGGAGCGHDHGHEPVYPVKGQATFQGIPMAGAMIGFHPVAATNADGTRKLSPTSVVKEDGTYALTSYLQADGAEAGDYIVTIFWPGPPSQTPDDGTLDDNERLPPDRLQRRYVSPQLSPLRATVLASDNQIDFALPP